MLVAELRFILQDHRTLDVQIAVFLNARAVPPLVVEEERFKVLVVIRAELYGPGVARIRPAGEQAATTDDRLLSRIRLVDDRRIVAARVGAVQLPRHAQVVGSAAQHDVALFSVANGFLSALESGKRTVGSARVRRLEGATPLVIAVGSD